MMARTMKTSILTVAVERRMDGTAIVNDDDDVMEKDNYDFMKTETMIFVGRCDCCSKRIKNGWCV